MLLLLIATAAGGETPSGGGLTEANKERRLIDDMDNPADWFNGSPEETTLATSSERVKQGTGSLKFANRVDHTKGEKEHPVGWPRTGKNLGKGKLTDFSGYDFFECWIYTETSRDALPPAPLAINFYYGGPTRSTSIPLRDLKKDAWVKVVVPIESLADPRDVQRVQFNISESNYRHGDRIDFYIDDVVLTRFVEPAIAAFELHQRLVYHDARRLLASYRLVGTKGMDAVRGELAIVEGEATVATTTARLVRSGEIVLPCADGLKPGDYQARLRLRDAAGRLLDQQLAAFRVIEGPFK